MKILISCLTIAVASLGLGQTNPPKDIVLAGDSAYAMLPPLPVATHANSLDWSTDGKYLLVTSLDPMMPSNFQAIMAKTPGEAEQSLVLFDTATRKQIVLWHSKYAYAMLQSVQWFKGSDTAVAIIVQRQRTVDPSQPFPSREEAVMIDGRTGTMRTVYSLDQINGEPAFDVDMSPTKPFGLLTVLDSKLVPTTAPTTPQAAIATNATGEPDQLPSWRYEYRLIDGSGTVGNLLKVDAAGFQNGWTSDGNSPILVHLDRKTRPIKRTWIVIDVATGAATPQIAVQFYKPPTLDTAVTVGPGKGTLTIEKTHQDVRPYWLQSSLDDSQALISSDAEAAELSPGLNAVAFVSQGVAMVRPIVRMPKAAYLEAMKAAAKTAALSNAKQIGLALIMFSADNDDKYPSNKDDIGKIIDPYMKNPDIFKGFVYTFGGGLASDIKDPASTVIGYMPGPGGRAVVYSDGHVKWANDN